jgi:predicted dinucleotide-binding enzyme
MNIGIIGAGAVGTGLTKRLVSKGHSVMLSFSRDSAKLASVAATLGARSGNVADAERFGEVVVLATPWTAAADALKQIPVPDSRKILWDCTNPLKPDLSGLLVGMTTSGGEEIAKLVPWARVVKAIPPFAEVLHSPNLELDGKRQSIFVCGDDQEARAPVAILIQIIGAEAVDAAPLSLARFAEPAAMLLVQLAYAHGFGVRIGVSFIREAAQSNAR